MTIRNKVSDVADSVCEDCPQNWQGTCRAFNLPHTEEERLHRTSQDADQGKMTCFPSATNAAPYPALKE